MRFAVSILLMLILVSCGIGNRDRTEVEVYIGLNPTLSNYSQYESAECDLAINRLLTAFVDSQVETCSISEYLVSTGPDLAASLSAKVVKQKLEHQRFRQSVGETPDAEVERLKGEIEGLDDYCWRWGTDHSQFFTEVMSSRDPLKVTHVLVISDGENEKYSWQDVRQSFQELVASGPVRLYILGISNRVVDEKSRLRVLDLWLEMLRESGLPELKLAEPEGSGYFITTDLEIPFDLFLTPFTDTEVHHDN